MPPWRNPFYTCPVRHCQQPFDLHGHHRAACTSKLQGIRQLLHDNLRDWIIFQFRAGGLAASHHDVPQHREDGDEDGRGKQGDILIHGQGGIFGHDTVLDVSRPHTHTTAGELKATALQAAAASKYRKHHAGYRALGIGFVPFIVDSLGRLHDDAQRILWHLAGKQIARNYQRRGWQAGGRHLRDYQRDHAQSARFLMISICFSI